MQKRIITWNWESGYLRGFLPLLSQILVLITEKGFTLCLCIVSVAIKKTKYKWKLQPHYQTGRLFLSIASGKPWVTEGLYLNSGDTRTLHHVQVKSLVFLNGLTLLLMRQKDRVLSVKVQWKAASTLRNEVQGENNFSCWERSLPRWDRTEVWDANSPSAYDFPRGKEEDIPHATARQQRQEEQREHLFIILRGEAFLLQDLPSTRGIGAIRQVYRRPSVAGTEMQPPSQRQRLVLLWHKMTTLMSFLATEADPPF